MRYPRFRSLLTAVLPTVLMMAATLPTLAQATQDATAEPAKDAAKDAQAAPGDQVAYLYLDSALRDGPLPFAWVPPSEAPPSLGRLLEQFQNVVEDDDYRGLAIELDNAPLSLTQAMVLGEAMQAISEAGKTTMVYAETYGLPQYLLACHADVVVMQPKGGVWMQGLSTEEMYLAGMLGKLGMKADLIQVGAFKGAADPMTRTEPSPEWDANINNLLDGFYDRVVNTIAQGRDVSKEQAENILGHAWTMQDTQLIEAGVIDKLADRKWWEISQTVFGDDEWDYDDLADGGANELPENPFALFALLMKDNRQKTRGPTLAVIHARGPIASGESEIGDGMFTSDTIGSQTVIEAVDRARDDDNIKGVVLRLDSPGGSAHASEMMWQALQELAETKPVYISVGSMAASGGYYLAVAGDQVFAEPGAILGSIGVVGGKFVLGETYEKIGVNITRRYRGPEGVGDLFNSVEPFNEAQRQAVQKTMEQIYTQFLDRVTAGRGDRLPDVDAVAAGRLFTAQQSLELGMIDEVGSLPAAEAALADQLGLENYAVLNLPEPISLGEYFATVFGVQSRPVELSLARELIGADRWPSVLGHLRGFMQLRDEPVLMITPSLITVE